MHAQVVPPALGGDAAIPGIAGIVVGVAALAYWANARRSGPRAENWPTTEATVTSSELLRDGEALSIEYEYEVDGQRYENDSVWLGSDADRHRVRSLVGSTPAGTTVRVHYDPDSPGASVMIPNPPRNLPILVVGVVFVLAGLAALVLL